ncbi:cation:proton antiporter domain-containing protein [Trichlorobacter ammonificans]|uniref:Sodium/hydrogen exchanger n=1 Tax=Trichlorobacter ammonificans TaxID=2916410 RepID=A0ABN8HCZ0_9BACT|nr:cation:proton antiporter [Trichlorobacter ammonificans]CAH2030531.1 Sodium/hydrogen exchanger [Trichlorobacter ammonificans]
MESINLIQDLAIILLGAGLAGALCRRAGLSVIVGYLLAGIVLGPHTPPFSFILDVQRIETLSQIGLVFLMFAIGLGLSLSKLQKMGAATLLATGLGAFFVLNLTQVLGGILGWSTTQSLFIAAMFMVSSSAVIAKVIKDMNLGRERSGQLALGITVLEDVVAVVMLTVLSTQASASASASAGVGALLTGMSAFVVLLVIAALFFIPKLLRRMEAKSDPELQTIVVAGILFLMAIMAAKAGYSLALGAYLLGAVIAELPQKSGVDKSFSGMRDMFSSVFFVSIGMMIDVRLMLDVWPWILGLCLFTLLARTLATGFALILVGTPPRTARRAGLALTPLGEFTFVIAQLGVTTTVLPPKFYPIAVGVSLLTVLITPIVNRHAEPMLDWIEAREPAWMRRGLEIYHGWLAQLSDLQGSQLWWQLSKKRLLQIALEALFITGLILFSQTLLRFFQQGPLAAVLTPQALTISFWVTIGFLVLIPLFAMWRNCSVLALMFAELTQSRIRLPAPLVENGFKAFSAVIIAYWLSGIVPLASLSKWSWLAIAAVLATVLLVFSHRLIYLHSKWQVSVKDIFTAETATDEAARRQAWPQRYQDWQINVQEIMLPEYAACSGASIADLNIRSRFGCSVVEIERQGYTIIAPESTMPLYPGDRLLLLGTAEQIDALRCELGRQQESAVRGDFDAARLETVVVEQGPRIGASLAELRIPLHTGVLVVGIRRGTRKIVNPSGDERLVAGDELLSLGSPEQLRRFKRWLVQDGESADVVPAA